MLTSLKTVLAKANKGNYAVGAFNINNLEIGQSIIESAILEKSPVIMQTSEGAIKYAGFEELAAIARVLVKNPVPIVYHLDHGKNFALVKKAVMSGYYNSVMIDASSLPFKDNIRKTREIVRLAHRKGVAVEAELGTITGVEDLVSVSEKEAILTDPEQAREFVKETGCDALAVAIGTSHGAFKFKGVSKLDIQRLQEIKMKVSVPLVLHGASSVPPALKNRLQKLGGDIGKAKGVSEVWIQKAVKNGINKVNIDTDLRIAFTVGIRSHLKKHPEDFDPRKLINSSKEEMVKVIRHKMKILGCSGKAR